MPSFGMHAIDWAIVATLFVLLIFVLVYCQKYIKSTADFLAANRCAGRYLLAITSGIAGIGAISIVASFEATYAYGFSGTFWGFLSGPIGMIISITGWVYYRLRETRCLTMAQFFEIRYSRSFRIFSGIMGWLSGILNYGIFPAVSVKFFIYFCQLPQTFHIGPIECSTYVCLLIFAISMGVIFAIFGGQIAIMMTDFLQGVFCNVAFLILMIYLVRHFNWNTIFESLLAHAEANPAQSMFNPFQTTAIKDFNIWYFLMGIALTILSNGTWQGSSGYTAAAKTAHEAKMSRFLGTWRSLVQNGLILFIPICAFTFFNHANFAEHASVVKGALDQLSGQDVVQARVPLFLAYMLPTGLVGLFAAVMFAAMLSTDDTYMHSWGAILIQDVIMPFRKSKKPLSAKQHLLWLRLSIVFVGVFAFFFSWLFKQTEYIVLFFQITGAIFTGGAGAVLIGGLYSKTASTLGARVAMIFGSATALGSIALQQTWTRLAPWLAGFCSEANAQWLLAHADRFPINSQILTFVITLSGFFIYFLFSYLDRKIHKLPAFNLNKMLHRGEYDTMGEHKENWSAGRIWRILGLTNEFTFFDRCLFFASICWTLIWFICFFIGLFSHFTGAWDALNWLKLWRFYVMLGFVLGIGTTIWFLICGLIDIRKLFGTLSTMVRNEADNGSVVDGQNAGEGATLAPAEKAPETK